MSLDSKLFVEALISEGYTHLCVVPCSFAKYVINEVINNINIEYIPSASEAVACSIAAGLKMSGAKPIVIVQSSGVTNMGSCITSLLNPYNITFPILTSWRTYKDGDSEIQHQHLSTQLPTLIEAYGYGHTVLDIKRIDNAIEQINLCNKTKTICIIKKDSFTKVELNSEHQLDLSKFTPRSEYLLSLNKIYENDNTLFIGTTGNTAREMYSFMKDTKNFYMAGNMGGALSLGLGVSKASKNVVVCGGDAEFVMHMGGLTTSARYSKDINLTYILFDNESNKSTGGQNTYQNHLDYNGIAESSGLTCAKKTIETIHQFNKIIEELKNQNGVKFFHVKCGLDDETPRPPLDVVKVKEFLC